MAGGLPLLISGASFGEWGAMDDEPEMEGASGTDGVTAAEAAQFERTRFEHSMATIGIGMGLSRLPWEQGLFAEIFNTGSRAVSRDLNILPRKRSSCHRRLAAMPIFAKHVKALTKRQ